MSAKTEPMNTYSTYLMYKSTTNGTYAKLIDVKDYPDDSEAEELDITTLSDSAHKSTPGIDGNDRRDYTANYTKGDYDTIKALEGQLLYFAEYFGENGDDGIFEFSGKLKVRRIGKGVNEVREMMVSVYPQSAITEPAS